MRGGPGDAWPCCCTCVTQGWRGVPQALRVCAVSHLVQAAVLHAAALPCCMLLPRPLPLCLQHPHLQEAAESLASLSRQGEQAGCFECWTGDCSVWKAALAAGLQCVPLHGQQTCFECRSSPRQHEPRRPLADVQPRAPASGSAPRAPPPCASPSSGGRTPCSSRTPPSRPHRPAWGGRPRCSSRQFRLSCSSPPSPRGRPLLRGGERPRSRGRPHRRTSPSGHPGASPCRSDSRLLGALRKPNAK